MSKRNSATILYTTPEGGAFGVVVFERNEEADFESASIVAHRSPRGAGGFEQFLLVSDEGIVEIPICEGVKSRGWFPGNELEAVMLFVLFGGVTS